MPDDPRNLGGSIAGPGGPYEKDAVVVDTTDAVLLDHTNVALVEWGRVNGDSETGIALLMAGRVNKTQDRVEILFMLNPDGATALVSELVGIAARAGGEFKEEFKQLLDKRIADLP